MDAEHVTADAERSGNHMMNPAFDQIMETDDETRLGLFTTMSQRLMQNAPSGTRS
ncbi:MAG: hypothetical protein DHS20C01_19830 [marine bacterium B5-7]|nr:MAG: hypothetical protein DHS20C01_19830 [marine bacterium B5-7]